MPLNLQRATGIAGPEGQPRPTQVPGPVASTKPPGLSEHHQRLGALGRPFNIGKAGPQCAPCRMGPGRPGAPMPSWEGPLRWVQRMQAPESDPSGPAPASWPPPSHSSLKVQPTLQRPRLQLPSGPRPHDRGGCPGFLHPAQAPTPFLYKTPQRRTFCHPRCAEGHRSDKEHPAECGYEGDGGGNLPPSPLTSCPTCR